MKPERKQRHPWIDADLAKQLKVYCAAKRTTETSVFNAALRDYLAEAKDSTLIMRRLDRNDRALAATRQTLDLLAETVLAFAQSYFCHTPEVPVTQRDIADRSARQRLEKLLDVAAKRYGGGKRLLDLVVTDVVANPDELSESAARGAR